MHGPDADQSAARGQLRLGLDQSDIALFGERVLDEGAVHFDPAGVMVATVRLGKRLTMLKCRAPPMDRARRANPTWAAAAPHPSRHESQRQADL